MPIDFENVCGNKSIDREYGINRFRFSPLFFKMMLFLSNLEKKWLHLR